MATAADRTYLYDMQQEIEERGSRPMVCDMFEQIYELLDYKQMSEVAAYGGFPTRYPHWRFGMEYERLSKSHSYGLSKIYELVINNDPCYAYLLEGQQPGRAEARDGARLRRTTTSSRTTTTSPRPTGR
jgi:spore cortex formation protein SpoVR/YcgB (stage V sporulation)